jgi:hypothetical protein
VIHVTGADIMDGTPILDIKPYIPYTDSHPDAKAGFTDTTEWKALKVVGTDDPILRKILEQDPRPHYHNDPERVYGMQYNGKDIHFVVKNGVVMVIG